MPYDGNGKYILPTPAYPAVSGEVIDSDRYNEVLEDEAAALSIAWPRDGQAAATADMSMGGKLLRDLAAGTLASDAVNKGQFEAVYLDPTFTGSDAEGVTTVGTATTIKTVLLDVDATLADFQGTTTMQVPDNTLIIGAVPSPADNTFKVASRNFVQTVAFKAALPLQAGNAGKVTTTDGATASWTAVRTINGLSLLGAGNYQLGLLKRQEIVAPLALTGTDYANWISCTGSFTFTLPLGSTLPTDWWIYLSNGGTGDVSLACSGADTLDALTGYVSYPKEARMIQWNGTNFRSVVVTGFEKLFTANGNFTKPPGYNAFSGQLWAAGGSGGRGSAGNPCVTGGGGGACAPFKLRASQLGAVEVVTLGVGGAAVAAADTVGVTGGTSSLGSLVFAYGGAGGSVGTAAGAMGGGGGGGTLSAGASAGNGGQPGQSFQDGTNNQTTSLTNGFGGVHGGGITRVGFSEWGGAAGLHTISGGGIGTTALQTRYGGGGGGCVSSAGVLGVGNSTLYGGLGGVSSVAGVATAGAQPGGGGGASRTGTSGAGGNGQMLIWGEA